MFCQVPATESADLAHRFVNLFLLFAVGVVCAIIDSTMERKFLRQNSYWTFGQPLSDDNPNFNGFTTFFNALITFQNVVPISLYISIEFVRTCQAAFIYFDSEMYYEPADQATMARSWNLSDDLGQVKFLVSDKTGTLTQVSLCGSVAWPQLKNVLAELDGLPKMLHRWQDLRRRRFD